MFMAAIRRIVDDLDGAAVLLAVVTAVKALAGHHARTPEGPRH